MQLQKVYHEQQLKKQQELIIFVRIMNSNQY